MPWAKRATKPIPPTSSKTDTVEINDYSLGMNSFISNDKFPVKNGGSNLWRLVQDARITTLGEYETRKGFDFHSAAAGETQDQAITSTTGAADRSFNSTTLLAQKFTTASAGALTKLEINLKNTASATGTVVISIYTDSAGVPGTLVASTSTDATNITTSYAYAAFRFASAPSLSSATVYWIVASVQMIGTNSYSWSSTSSATTALTSSNSGASWSSTSYALNFRQYYATVGGAKGLKRLYKTDGTKVTLFAHGTTLYSVNEVSGALTAIKTGLSASATKYRFDIMNDIVYYVNGFDGYRKWNGTTESQVNSTNYTLIAAHKGLMFLGGGVDPNAVIYSNFGLPETFTSTDFVYADSPKTGDPVSALLSLNGNLFIFSRSNKYVLSGSDNATFSIDEAPDQKGTYTQETVTKDNNFMYFLSNDGVYRSNGAEPHIMSNNNYQEILTMANKDKACINISKGRVRLWYPSAGSSVNDSCFVYNTNFSSSDNDCLESKDTGAYVAFALNAYLDNDDLMVASSKVGQVFWQEKDSNDYNNLGEALDTIFQTHYFTGSSPAVLKQNRYWEPRFAATSGNYKVDCQYAYDRRDNWQTVSSPSLQGSGPVWGSGIIWGSFTWGTTSEVQSYLYVPGEYRRMAIRYRHTGMRQPIKFLGHTFVNQQRRIR